VISGGFAVAGLVDPALIGLGAAPPMARVYAQLHAARAIPLTVVMLVVLAGRGRAVAVEPLLVVAGIAQLADAAIGVGFGKPNMIVGGTVLATIHLASAMWVRRTVGTKSGSSGS
jgi:hypothetical protein